MRKNYGIPYMGSKNKIAEKIIDFLPAGDMLIDLFGGGGAITDCAKQSNKWNTILYNEIDPLPYKCFTKALKGEYKNETRWISKEDFNKLKDTDEYVACCFSFGNNFKTYMYNKVKEPYKRAYHYAIVFNDFEPLCKILDNDENVKEIEQALKGITDKKERRLVFQRSLGRYILEREEHLEKLDRLNEIKSTVLMSKNSSREVSQNQQYFEQLNKICVPHDEINNILFFNTDYRNINLPEGSIIYCDIPYKNTGGYKHQFDYDYFYDWCILKKNEGHQIFISEYSMPEDRFKCVFEVVKRCSFSQTMNKATYEKIYVPK